MSNRVFARIGELARGMSDAFAYPLRTSHYLELVHPLWTTHALKARVESVWDETADTRTLTLRPGRNYRMHRAGQHVRVGVAVDGKQHTRTYSVSSEPEREDGCFTITVKAVGDGRVSQHLVRKVMPGDVLPIGIAQGDFVLPHSQPVKPLFITAGSGITPVMSMLRSLVAQERLPDTVHIHYAPHARDVIFGDELRKLAEKHPRYKLHMRYTRQDAPVEGLHFTPERLFAICGDVPDREIYACGPAALLDAVEAFADDAGLRQQLHTERFRAAFAPHTADAEAGEVRFEQSKVSRASDGKKNLLILAEEAGLNPAHGCRMGICHACDTKLVCGAVRDLRTGDVLSEPGQLIQPCVCASVGDATIAL